MARQSTTKTGGREMGVGQMWYRRKMDSPDRSRPVPCQYFSKFSSPGRVLVNALKDLTLPYTGSQLVVGESSSRSGRSSFSILPAHPEVRKIGISFGGEEIARSKIRSLADIEGVVVENSGIGIGTGSDRYTMAIFRQCMICPTRAAT